MSEIEQVTVERCDADCPQRATHIVMVPGPGAELLFCLHHIQRHRQAIEAQGGVILPDLEVN